MQTCVDQPVLETLATRLRRLRATVRRRWMSWRVQEINLVVTDWMMPNVDGAELCRRVRSRPFGKYIYIILLTGRYDESALVDGMEAGADDFLTKPPNLAELRVRLKGPASGCWHWSGSWPTRTSS